VPTNFTVPRCELKLIRVPIGGRWVSMVKRVDRAGKGNSANVQQIPSRALSLEPIRSPSGSRFRFLCHVLCHHSQEHATHCCPLSSTEDNRNCPPHDVYCCWVVRGMFASSPELPPLTHVSQPTVKFDSTGTLRTYTLNRPKKMNALDESMLSALRPKIEVGSRLCSTFFPY